MGDDSEELKNEFDKRKEVEKQIQQRLSYEQAISKCSSLLLESTSLEALRQSLAILRQVTDSDRVYIYKNRQKDDGLYMDLTMEKTADGVSTMHKITETQFKYDDFPWWYERLSANKIINEHVEDIPGPAGSQLKNQQIKSVLVIPIRVNDEWFGYIGFAQIQRHRTWEENEISLLETAAGIIAAFEKRRQIEQSLVQQRNYTKTILDSLPSIYLLMDKELQFVQWNSNAERYTGYSGEELEQKSAFDLVVSEDHEELRAATERVRNNKSEGTELRLLTKSGEVIPYFWKGYFINVEGQDRFLCVGLDITEQKETERELMDEKRFNEALMESLPGIFYMIDSDGNYERWNQNFIDELGYTSEEIEEMTPADFYSDKEYQRIKEGIQEVFEEGESDIEATIITKDGTKIPYYLTGKLFKQNGENYLVGVGYDISEQKQAREQLRKSEELFRNLFLKAPAAIVMVSPDNKVRNINNSFKDLFGYSEEELKGRDIDEVLVPDDEYGEAPKMGGNSHAMASFNKEAKRIAKDGTVVDVFVAAIPVYVDGEPLAGFGMYIDITEQKRYEEKIYSSLKEKHVLLKEIHHRVKNNLAVVSGLLQLQMYETDDPVIRDTLKESESRIQTMAMIHEKLYNSQNLSRISCESYIGDLVETIRNTNRSEKDLSVDIDIAEVELTITKAVPFALLVNEVVTNSFKHAFKEQDEGSISIEVEDRGDELFAHISDNGRGLPEEFSFDDSDSLGMTLIQNFIKQLDGDFEIGSNNGTYLELTFPIENSNGSTTVDLIDL